MATPSARSQTAWRRSRPRTGSLPTPTPSSRCVAKCFEVQTGLAPLSLRVQSRAHWWATWQADEMSANGLTNNIPSWADSTPPGNNAWRMCKKGY